MTELLGKVFFLGGGGRGTVGCTVGTYRVERWGVGDGGLGDGGGSIGKVKYMHTYRTFKYLVGRGGVPHYLHSSGGSKLLG